MKIPQSITDIHKCYLNKDFSCLELTDYYLDKIEKFDSALNSYITVTPEIAREQAKKVDIALSRLTALSDFKPLLGVPVAHKDLFLTKGVKTTAASKVLTDYIPVYSSTVVEKVSKNGGVMLGKLNCDAWAHGSSGENSDYGATKNPWNADYVSGGSSSGSAAAVSAGLSHFATSTDTCGSTRLPASFCGVVGMKPTNGAVSRYGVVAMASSLDTVGHITRTTGDAKRVFGAISGLDSLDSTLAESKFKPKNKNITIGVPKEFFGEGVSSDIKKSIDKAISIMSSGGFKFKDVSLPHTKYAISAYYIIQPAEVSSNLSRYDGVRFGGERAKFGDEARRRIMLGTYVLSSGYYDAYYTKAMKVRSVIVSEINNVFENVDALIGPVSPSPAFKLGERSDDPLKMYLTDVYAATANLTGIPSLALPYGESDGLPIGFQLMGPRFSESMLFSIGEEFEKMTDYTLNLPEAYGGI